MKSLNLLKYLAFSFLWLLLPAGSWSTSAGKFPIRSTIPQHSPIPEYSTTNAPLKACKDHEVRNKEGVCVCQDGYTKNPTTQHCEDINECETGEHSCALHSSTCQNLVGSYECLCKPGFEKFDNDNECVNINECEKPDLEKCHVCYDTPGSFKCLCYDGYILQADGKTCIEENKCESPSFCNGICYKTDFGNYICKKCPNDQFRLDRENEKCIPVRECREGETCFEEQCDEGFYKNSTTGICENINRCREQQPGKRCSDHHAVCRKLINSYECFCDKGKLWNETTKQCEGFRQCETSNANCQHLCVESYNSFFCVCFNGYDLLPDKKTCVNENPCFDKAFCDGFWEQIEGECRCTRCPYGLFVSDLNNEKKEECFEINQCKGSNICPLGETCVDLKNGDSTASCVDLSCPEDYELRNEDGVCTKREGINDDRALAITKRLLRFPFNYVKIDVQAPKRAITIYRFNRTGCPRGDEVEFKLENIEPKFMKKYEIKKESLRILHQKASHDLMFAGWSLKREQEFKVELTISCKRKKMQIYILHVFLV